MKKIKKFKIDISTKRIFEILKSRNLLTSQDFTEEDLVAVFGIRDTQLVKKEKREEIENAISLAHRLIVPSMTYTTLNKENIKKLFTDMDDLIKLTKEWLAASFWAVTIGENLEKEVKNKELEGNLLLSSMLDAIGWEALREAASFAGKLIALEAKKQECELMTRFDNYCKDWDNSINEKILQILEGEKVGISYEKTGGLSPPKSMLALIGWVSSHKSH